MFKALATASASTSVLMLASTLENGYGTDAYCEWYRYKSMWAITSINADARCGYSPRYFKSRLKSRNLEHTPVTHTIGGLKNTLRNPFLD